jgi:RNA polymerase sigma-70 factor (ECF subfamily)
MVPGELTDEEIVARYRAESDYAARAQLVNELFARHYKTVARWCYRVTGDTQSAADMAQDVFLKAYRSLDSFRINARFTTWLYSISKNHCLNEVKSQTARGQEAGEEALLNLASSVAAVDETLERQASIEQMRQLMADSLDETERTVMTLHYGEDIPLDAITRLLNLANASGAKAHIVSARRKLNRALERLKARG